MKQTLTHATTKELIKKSIAESNNPVPSHDCTGRGTPPHDTPAWRHVWQCVKHKKYLLNKIIDYSEEKIIKTVTNDMFGLYDNFKEIYDLNDIDLLIKYLIEYKIGGIEAAEKFAGKFLAENFEPYIIEGGLRLDDYDKRYSLYDDTHMNRYYNFINSIGMLEDDIVFEITGRRPEYDEPAFPDHAHTTDRRYEYNQITLFDFYDYPTEEVLNSHYRFVDEILSKSRTLSMIQRDIHEVNRLIAKTLTDTGRVYRGGSVDELVRICRNNGEVGHHKRQGSFTKDKDFVSTSVEPAIAMSYTVHDGVKEHDGVLVEFDVSEMDETEVRAVSYDLKGMKTHNASSRRYSHTWPTEKFGGFNSPDFTSQAEVHIKVGSKPRIMTVWLDYKMDEKKKKRVKKMLQKTYADITIYESRHIGCVLPCSTKPQSHKK